MTQSMEAMRKRIEVAGDLHSVVRLMKALAAVSIAQFEKAVESLTEYHAIVEAGLQILLRDRPPVIDGPDGRRLNLGVVVFGSDQGMCGNFNEQVVAFARQVMEEIRGLTPHVGAERRSGSSPVLKQPPHPRPVPGARGERGLSGERKLAVLNEPLTPNRHVLVVGARAASRLRDAGQAVATVFSLPGAVASIPLVLERVLVRLEALREKEAVGRLLVIHNHPTGASGFQPVVRQLLPVDETWLGEVGSRPWVSRTLPMYTLEWRTLFAALIRQHLFLALYRACAESLAAENACRLACMQAAEKSIDEHLQNLRGEYHQWRQQSITEELLDVLGGYESLVGDSLRQA